MRVTSKAIKAYQRRIDEARAVSRVCPEDVAVRDPRTGEVEYWVTGPEAMAILDIKRLAAAQELERELNRRAADQKKGDVLTEDQLATLEQLKSRRSMHRAMVSSFKKDHEDVVLRRGRWKPAAVHSPARPFNSSAELVPTEDWICPVCGLVHGSEQAQRMHGVCKRHEAQVPLERVWSRPELAERWALVKARAEAGEGVAYRAVFDADTGVWLRNEAVTHGEDGAGVGFGALLEIAKVAPTGEPSPLEVTMRQLARQEAQREARAADAAAVDAATVRADTIRKVEVELAAADCRAKRTKDIATVEVLYGACAVTTARTPRRSRNRGKRRGKGNRETQRQRSIERRSGKMEQQPRRRVLDVKVQYSDSE